MNDNIYKNVEISYKSYIKPNQLNNNIDEELESNIKTNLESKCYNNYGYIDKILKIERVGNPYLLPEDFSGNSVVDTIIICKIFNPPINSIITCTTIAITNQVILVKTIPLLVYIPFNKINSNIINENNSFKQNNKVLSLGDQVSVKIIAKRISANSSVINAIGFLENIL